MLKLYHNSDLIGLIRNYNQDGSVLSGDIELTLAATAYKELFLFFTDEEKFLYVDPPFDQADLENWSIENEEGRRAPIAVPGVYDDGEIRWRYW